MKLSTSLAVFSLAAALCAIACGSDTEPTDEGQSSELTEAELAAAKGEDHGTSTVETAGTIAGGTDIKTGTSTCTSCGPLPDPWSPSRGPLPDPWKSTSSGGGTGTGTSSTGTGTGGSSGH